MSDLETELLQALKKLREEVIAYRLLDVHTRLPLCIATTQAGVVIAKATAK